MVLHHIIRIIKTLSICATTKLTLELMQNGTFFATFHGKGPCDRLGGTVKRLAAKSSL